MHAATPPSLPDSAGEDASTVLDRVRAELAALHGMVLELQHALGPTLTATAADGAVLRAGQALDHITQLLDGLATFVGAASNTALGPGRLDAVGAAARIKLDDLAGRLAGRSPTATQPASTDEVELF